MVQIFGIIINVAILLVFFRFLMQLAAVNPYNPVVLSTGKATKIVDVFSRILPTVAKVGKNTGRNLRFLHFRARYVWCGFVNAYHTIT